jgi:hypothetical protein
LPPNLGTDPRMTELHQRELVGLARPVASTTDAGLDSLHQVAAPLVPEIRLHLTADAIVLSARMDPEARMTLAAPVRASAWLGAVRR